MYSVHLSANIAWFKHQRMTSWAITVTVVWGEFYMTFSFLFFFAQGGGSLSRMGLAKLLPAVILRCLCPTVNVLFINKDLY